MRNGSGRGGRGSLAPGWTAFLIAGALGGCRSSSPCPRGTALDPKAAVTAVGPSTWSFCRGAPGETSYALASGEGRAPREQCPWDGTALAGTYLAWHADGTLFLRGLYREGAKQGTWEQWASSGGRVASGAYRDGRLVAGAPVGTASACETLRFPR